MGTCCFWLSLYLYVPILPIHSTELGANLEITGFIIASYALGQLIFRIPIGILSDIFSRKLFTIIAFSLSSIGALILGLSENPHQLLLGRSITGISAAGWVSLTVLFSSFFSEEKTQKSVTILMIINTTCVVLATFTGGILAEYYNNSITFYISFIIGIIGIIFLLFSKEPDFEKSSKNYFLSIKKIVINKTIIRISIIAITLQFIVFGVNFAFLPIYVESLGASKSEVGFLTSSGMLATVFGTLVSFYLQKKINPSTCLFISSFMIACSLIIFSINENLIIIFIVNIFNGFGRGLMNTILISLTLIYADKNLKATTQGVYQALYSIGMLLGPAISGVLAQKYSIDYVFIFSTIIIAFGGILSIIKPFKEKK
tara:strand:- start:229 stop:1344 length:1116 start_codon:yes stop_codon:yes gene_type:complete